MNSIRNTIYIILTLTILTSVANAQESERFTEIWQSVHLDYNITKKWESHLRLEGRFSGFESEYRTALVEAETGYELLDWLSTELYYRYRVEKNEDAKQRLALQLSPTWKTGDLRLGFRLRYEWNEISEDPKERLRIKVRPKWKFGAHDISPYVEWFVKDEGELQRTRFGLGWGYKFDKKNRIKIRWMFDDEEDEDTVIFRLGYHRSLN